MKTIQQEYAFYTENFEIYQFKFKTYGAGKWANTYDEAHELAKEAVLKKCMEENPHLAFQDKPVINTIKHLNGNPPNFYNPIPTHNDETIPPEKINKDTIEPYNLTKEIESCKSPALLKVLLKTATTKEEKELCNKKLAELQKQTI